MAEQKYAKAMGRLEEIVEMIDNGEIDVDELTEKVTEAVTLIKMCKDKIKKAELEVKQIVSQFEKEE